MRSNDTSRHYVLLQTVQWVAFALLLFGCYLTETAGSFIKPLLLIPLALCISARIGEIQAMAVGTISGLLLDVACGKLLGYNALWLVVCCVIVSLLHAYLLRDKLLNILILTAVCTAVQGYLDYVFYYAIWGHENVELIYTNIMLPSGIMTVIFTVPLYFIVRWIARACGNRRIYELEKTIVMNNY